MKNPWRHFGTVTVFAVCGYVGVNFVLLLVRTHGALVTVSGTSAFLTLDPSVSVLLQCSVFLAPGFFMLALYSFRICVQLVTLFLTYKTVLSNRLLWTDFAFVTNF